jgi:hypothetical protein
MVARREQEVQIEIRKEQSIRDIFTTCVHLAKAGFTESTVPDGRKCDLPLSRNFEKEFSTFFERVAGRWAGRECTA